MKSASANIPRECGGIDYSGPTECEDGLVCTRVGSDWWYSCNQPGS
jgi:hypothetical protein